MLAFRMYPYLQHYQTMTLSLLIREVVLSMLKSREIMRVNFFLTFGDAWMFSVNDTKIKIAEKPAIFLSVITSGEKESVLKHLETGSSVGIAKTVHGQSSKHQP